eukprot:11011502-Alexandrium_andersonii.AAC.1
MSSSEIATPRAMHIRSNILDTEANLSSGSAWPRTVHRCPSSTAQTLAASPNGVQASWPAACSGCCPTSEPPSSP